MFNTTSAPRPAGPLGRDTMWRVVPVAERRGPGRHPLRMDPAEIAGTPGPFLAGPPPCDVPDYTEGAYEVRTGSGTPVARVFDVDTADGIADAWRAPHLRFVTYVTYVTNVDGVWVASED